LISPWIGREALSMNKLHHDVKMEVRPLKELVTSSGVSQPPSPTFMRSLEEHAIELRRRAGVGPTEPFDPNTAAIRLGVTIISLDNLPQMPPEDRELLSKVDARVWSGVGLPLPGGGVLVILHPRQTKERAAVTIMEEVAHAYYGHAPSHMLPQFGGFVQREYDPKVEQEAYWTAAAALLPSAVVARSVWQGRSAEELAADYGVSVELVEFRIKTLRLWPKYCANCPAREAA
jgi:hypothetical protein